MMVFRKAMDSMKKRISAPASTLSAKKTSSKKSVESGSRKTAGTKKKITEADLYGMITKQAYELYLKRGCNHGNDQSDWFKAEQIVRGKYKIY